MNVDVRREGGCWSVYVNDARVIDRESQQIADNVAECLRDPAARPFTESREVADAILAWAS